MKTYKNRYIICILITLSGVLAFSFTNETFIKSVKNSIAPNITASFYSQIVFHVYNISSPFNPVTKIKFDTPPLPSPKGRESLVRLTVYDIFGREIAVLVDEHLKPGTYYAEWDASNYPSGVYFYKLETDDFSESKKMVLIK